MLATHLDTEQHYELLRKQALQVTTETIQAQGVQMLDCMRIINRVV